MSTRLGRSFRRAVRRARQPVLRRIRPHGLILMYHRIAQSSHGSVRLCVTPAHFREHLEVLSRRATVVPLAQLSRHLQTSRVPRLAVAVTFDDGYVDNFETGLPLLQQYDTPATVFIATDWIGRHREFWWDLLARAILEPARIPSQIEVHIGPEAFRWAARHEEDRTSAEARNALLAALWGQLQTATEPQREAALDRLCAQLDVMRQADPAARPMNEEELRRLHASGLVEIGAHTRSHCPLPKLSHEQQRQEIFGSRSRCQELLGAAPCSFSYPYGEVDASSRELVAQAGFERAVESRLDVLWQTDDPLRMPRAAVADCDGAQFERRLQSGWLT